MDNKKKKIYSHSLSSKTKTRLEELSKKNNISQSLIIDILISKQKRDYIF